MKFIAQKSQIVEALQNAAAVAERRQTIPILANLRIKAQNGSVEVTATDLEIQIQASSSVVSTDEEGETTVSARKMSELCRSLPDNEEISFSLAVESLRWHQKDSMLIFLLYQQTISLSSRFLKNKHHLL